MWSPYLSMFFLSLFVVATSDFLLPENFPISYFFINWNYLHWISHVGRTDGYKCEKNFDSISSQIFFPSIVRFKWDIYCVCCMPCLPLRANFPFASCYVYMFLHIFIISFYTQSVAWLIFFPSLLYFIFLVRNSRQLSCHHFRCWISMKMLSCDVAFD